MVTCLPRRHHIVEPPARERKFDEAQPRQTLRTKLEVEGGAWGAAPAKGGVGAKPPREGGSGGAAPGGQCKIKNNNIKVL